MIPGKEPILRARREKGDHLLLTRAGVPETTASTVYTDGAPAAAPSTQRSFPIVTDVVGSTALGRCRWEEAATPVVMGCRLQVQGERQCEGS